MLFYDINYEDFVAVLRALPEPPSEIRAHLAKVYGVLVSSDDPEEWWRALWLDRGEEGAAKVVAQLVISMGGQRVVQLLDARVRDRDLAVRADDSKLARLLFDEAEEELLTDQWALVNGIEEYYEQTQLVEDEDEDLPGPEVEMDDFEGEEEDEPEDEDTGPDIFDLISGKPRPSAQRGAEWVLQRVQHPPRGFIEVPAEWSEGDLENFLWLHWEKIDFGFDRPIYLVDRQKNINPANNDRVDLLARGRSGEHIAVELKIVEARRGDYTQLMSYLGDLESVGVPSDKVRGVLIAPSFSAKVLSSAAIERRVTLLRFFKRP